METTSFGSFFILIFLGYCGLIILSHLIEFLRLHLFRRDPGGYEVSLDQARSDVPD